MGRREIYQYRVCDSVHQEFTHMFRKALAVVAALMFVVGGLFAEEVKGVFKKCEGGKVCIEVDGKVQEYKVGDAKVKIKDKEIALTDILSKYKEGQAVVATVEKGELTKIKKDKK